MAYNSFERRINARKQLRGKDGKWIFMGGSVKWLNKALGALSSGRVNGIDGDYVNITGNDGQDYRIHRSAISSIPAKAHLPSAGGSLLSVKGTDKDGVFELRVSNDNTVTPKNLKVGDRVYGGSPTNPNGPPTWAGKAGQSWYSQKTNGETWEVVSIEDQPADLNITYKNANGGQKTVLTPKSPGVRLIPENEELNDGIAERMQATTTEDENSITDVSDWSLIKSGLGGSNGAALYENPDTGETYVVKFPKSDRHARNEVLASRLYAAAGIPMPSSELVTKDGKIGVATAYMGNTKGTLNDNLDNPEFIQNLREGFAVDAWLANWDVTGLDYDNVLADENNEPVRIDPGGALLFRAQGASKGDAFGPEVGEWESLKTSAQGKTVFGGMSDEDRIKSAELVSDISDDEIRDIVNSVGFGNVDADHITGTLILRKEDLLEKAGLAEGEKAELPEEPESTTTDRNGMISDALNDPSASKLSNATKYVSGTKTIGLKSTDKVAYGDIYVINNAGNMKTGVLISKIREDDGVETWSAVPNGIAIKDQNSSSDVVQVKLDSKALIFRPYAIYDVALPDIVAEEAAPEAGKFTPLADTGISGDGYHPSGPWGVYGASGLMVQDTDTGEILIVQRGPGSKNNAGKWQLPGGALDSKENIYQGAARESMEELNMSQEYLDTLDHKGDYVYDNGKGWTYSTIAVTTNSDFDLEIDGSETGDATWVTPYALQEMKKNGDLVPAFSESLDDTLALLGVQKKEEKAEVETPKPPVNNVYALEEIETVLNDFFSPENTTYIKYFDLDGGGGILADKGDDEKAIIFYPDTNDSSNNVSFSKADIEKNGVYTLIDDALFGGSEASDPNRAPRLSTSAVDLDELPEGSVVKFASAPDDKVYLKGSDGSWEASWLSEDHKQKNVKSENIHAVAAYLGEDVQIVKDDSAPEVPPTPEVEETPTEDVLQKVTIDTLERLPVGSKIEFISDSYPESQKLGPYEKGENGMWSKPFEDGTQGTDHSPTALEDALYGYSMKVLPHGNADSTPEVIPENVPEIPSMTVTPDVAEEVPSNAVQMPMSQDVIDRFPTGTQISITSGDTQFKHTYGPYTKNAEGMWVTPPDNFGDGVPNGSEVMANAFSNEIMDVVLPEQENNVELADWEKELLGIPTDTPETQPISVQLDELEPGTKVKFSTGGGVYTKTEDGKIQGLSGTKYPTEEFNNDKSFIIVQDEPVAPALHPENPTIVDVVDGINIDENGDQWVAGKDGKPVYVGDVVVSKVNEAGKVTALLKNGKIRVTTAEGDTKFWGKHLVTKGDDSLLVPTGYMYQVKVSSNGTEYVTTKSGVDIYVGDTVQAPGKAGFEGKVTGIAPNGQFVLVEDPETGKIKPRKIDKITVTASVNESNSDTVEEEEEIQVPGLAAEAVDKVELNDLVSAPEGSQIHVWDAKSDSEGKVYQKKSGYWVDVADKHDIPFSISSMSVAMAQDEDEDNLSVTLTLPTAESIAPTADTDVDLNDLDPVLITNIADLDAAPIGSKMSVKSPSGKVVYYEKQSDKGWAIDGSDPNNTLGSYLFQYLIDDNEPYVVTLNDKKSDDSSNKALTDVVEVNSLQQLEDAEEGAIVNVISGIYAQSTGLSYYKTSTGWSPVGDPSFTIQASDFKLVIEGDGYNVSLTNDTSPKKDGEVYLESNVPETTTPESTQKVEPVVEELPTDPSSPWFGVDAPTEPSVPGDVSDAKYLPDSWVDGAKKTYLDLKSKEFTSSGYWPQMEGLILLGDNSLPSTAKIDQYGPQEDRFDFFKVRGFITEEQAIEGRKLLEERSIKIKKDLQDYADAKEKYVKDLNEWKTANGIPLKGLNPATFKLSGPGVKFSSANMGESWADKNLPTAVDILTPQEIGAVQAWTTVGGDNGYQPEIPWKSFSIALRSGKKKVYEDIDSLGDKKMIEMAKNIDSAIAKSEVAETFTTVRNADLMNFNTASGGSIESHAQMLGQVDTIVTDFGFIASSASNAPGYGSGNVVLEITIPKGANALWLSGKNSGNGKNALGSASEYEVLLPRGTQLYIHEVTSGPYNKTHVKAEVVPENWTPPVGVTSGPVAESDAVPQGPVSSVDETIAV